MDSQVTTDSEQHLVKPDNNDNLDNVSNFLKLFSDVDFISIFPVSGVCCSDNLNFRLYRLICLCELDEMVIYFTQRHKSNFLEHIT